MKILAIDPGNVESAAVLYLPDEQRVVASAYAENGKLWEWVRGTVPLVSTMVVEMIASYGMPVGAEVFETCRWIGRIEERWLRTGTGGVQLLYRKDVKMHLCNSMKAKDGNIRAALMDKFGGKGSVGTKKKPGPLYGISGDKWAALGVAVTFAELNQKGQ